MAQWYYAKSGQQLGPVSAEDMQGLARSGALAGTDLVWSEGMSGWAEARTVAGLFAPEAATPTQATGPAGGYGAGPYAPAGQGQIRLPQPGYDQTQAWPGG